MTLLPVIGRELRVAARASFSYYLRVLGAVALLVVLVLPGVGEILGPGEGGKLFACFHCTLFVAIWLMVPLLAADAISRERREGTLPLLFLTPLTPRGIVLGKGMAHGLRAFTLWLAALPVLAIPFLLGGVGWLDVVLSVCVNFASLCLALAAGLTASAIMKSRTQALGLAVILAGVFGLVFITALPCLCVTGILIFTGNEDVLAGALSPWPEVGLVLTMNREDAWNQLPVWLMRTYGSGVAPVLAAYAANALLSSYGALLACRLAARFVARRWRDEPPSLRVQRVRDRFCTPMMFQGVLKRWLRGQLQRNPIGWLERRNWSGRLVVWSWFAIVTCVYSSLITNLPLYKDGFEAIQMLLGVALAFGMAVSAAGSFRRERESGVLELLLIAPLPESRIITGRVRGLCGQFIPASVLLCGVWLYLGSVFAEASQWPSVLLYVVTFLTLPFVGLYFSLTCRTFIGALVWTLLLQFALPAGLMQAFVLILGLPQWASDEPGSLLLLPIIAAGLEVLLALLLWWRLHENLKRRKFALQRASL